MLANITDTRIVQSARVKLNGQVVPIHQATYMVGDQGPFTDAFEGDQFTPENVEAAQAARIVNLHRIGVPLPHPPVQSGGDPNQFELKRLPTPVGPGQQAAAITAPLPPLIHTVRPRSA